ncbi:uncharacterized protein B0H18DRAFT_978859 [Fomitopsis serialis]|uniref:uncharacterized protein n=1 Tax=Fomitopsis serialis TaxID=139415 RepID=UPI0020074C41|nr:uncharacterized protein B0H18DRAFT_978859 [Neoantrodia serialis]KAH9934897.1 hypothetical protein B0H18DRAFT_978859 [Neoantrodia serialis]
MLFRPTDQDGSDISIEVVPSTPVQGAMRTDFMATPGAPRLPHIVQFSYDPLYA